MYIPKIWIKHGEVHVTGRQARQFMENVVCSSAMGIDVNEYSAAVHMSPLSDSRLGARGLYMKFSNISPV